MMVMLLLLLAVSQSGSFVVSLLLIPASFFNMMAVFNIVSLSGVVLLLFVLVFVGGLLVLLVSLTSVLSLEQSSRYSGGVYFIIFSMTLSSFMEFMPEINSMELSKLFNWLSSQLSVFELVFFIFLISLVLITWCFSILKSMSRVILSLSL
uniref:NADH dehydrogenase subunit 6 n=1 Tax=Longidorus vineacola TaxID=241698 RepID=A0A1P8C782_9BILA|nr:NADH dehydrogenase subunit 6 [Longidorus vineacola]AOT84236.1 NADH dehydrogenase subunit 6 [Longidorus vineacola]